MSVWFGGNYLSLQSTPFAKIGALAAPNEWQNEHLRDSNKGVPATWVFLGLFALVVFGTGILFLISSFENQNEAHEMLLVLGDWMVKASVGAILGFAGGARLAARNGGS